MLVVTRTEQACSSLNAFSAETRPRRPTASTGLLSPVGLARRLLTGSFGGWTVRTFFLAVAFCALASSLEDMIGDIPR